ncbi:MAG: carboxypeptidase regulatory-like domain-containing protein [Lewinellaceae bacterium]|nr:carboxypeptidase regulatory-like domain-containing protein [Lewinellaceae bacterium]
MASKTDGNGYYSFEDLAPGSYIVGFDTPTGYTPTTANVGNDATDSDNVGGYTGTIVLDSGENDDTNDAGYISTGTSLGDYVWEDTDGDGLQDSGEPGVSGVTVNLKDAGGNVIATTTTDGNGYYHFTGLVPGTYSVQFVLPGGYEFTQLNQGGDESLDSDADATMNGMTNTVTLASGDNYEDLDAGLYQPASLGDYVWEDLDGDGQQDSGEPGISGVTVSLYEDANNDGTPDGAPIATTTTDGNGYYSFEDLAPGSYIVGFDTPTGYTPTTANVGNDATDSDNVGGYTGTIVLDSGENDDTNDAGYISTGTSLGDYVWEDTDGDGLQDSGEPGVSGVTVNLKDAGGNVIATTTTDGNGYYHFTGLVPGTYSVQFVLPGGYEFTQLNQGGDESLDSDADATMNGMTNTVTLASGDNYEDLDAGLYQPASLGDYVWEDLDGDGQQDSGEPGISGVTVSLYEDANNDGTPDGAPIATTTTDGNGYYSFEDLAPGVRDARSASDGRAKGPAISKATRGNQPSTRRRRPQGAASGKVNQDGTGASGTEVQSRR